MSSYSDMSLEVSAMKHDTPLTASEDLVRIYGDRVPHPHSWNVNRTLQTIIQIHNYALLPTTMLFSLPIFVPEPIICDSILPQIMWTEESGS